jgi:hypothetical protein
MQVLEDILIEITRDPQAHARWLNTLSLMENAGAKKIKNCEHPVFVNEIILKHSAEEARHAYYLKKQIGKIAEDACPTYERKYILAPQISCFYLHSLDIAVSRYLKERFGFSLDKLKYASYLLVTYAIEVRADALYPVYQDVLNRIGSKVSVKTIIAEEKNHLEEMISQLRAFSPQWEEMCQFAVEQESLLFEQWLNELSRQLSVKASSIGAN